MAKCIVEESKRVRMWWLKRNGYLKDDVYGGMEWTSGWDESKSSIGFYVSTNELYIRFQYSQTDSYTDEKSSMDYKFNLTTTTCHYGGVRYWFVCGLSRSGRYCGRRVGVLYKPPGSKYFGCRHCFELSYNDRNLNKGGKYGSLFKVLDFSFKAEKLEDKIKRRYWRNEHTRKYRRFLKYINKANAYASSLDSLRI